MSTGYRNRISDFMHWFGLAMVATYFGLGIYVLNTSNLDYLNKNIRFIFGFFFLAFGFFRAVNWYQKHKSRKFYSDSDTED